MDKIEKWILPTQGKIHAGQMKSEDFHERGMAVSSRRWPV